jgi:thiol-disulfide isomerase/thioredoxin
MSKNKVVVYAVVLVTALIAGFLLSRYLHTDSPPAVANGDILTEPFTDLTGAPKTVGDWHVNVTLVNFWATWCAPCREEIPLFMTMLERYRERGFRVVGVAIDEAEAVNQFRDELLINYPLLILEDNVNAVMRRYGDGMAILPYSVLVDARGNIAAKKLGAYEHKELDTLLAQTLAAQGAAN